MDLYNFRISSTAIRVRGKDVLYIIRASISTVYIYELIKFYGLRISLEANTSVVRVRSLSKENPCKHNRVTVIT